MFVSYNIAIFIVIIGIFIFIRFSRNFKGYKFRTSSLLRRPLAYLLILILSFFSFGNYTINALTLLFIFPGIILGIRTINNIIFFNAGNTIYYKRPFIIMVFWLISLIIRYILIFMFPGNIYIIIFVNGLLAITTGIIIGESVAIYKKYRLFQNESNNI